VFRRKRREPEPEVLEITIPAHTWLSDVLHERRRIYGDDDPRTITVAIDLARALRNLVERRVDALDLYLWVLPVLWSTHGPTEPDVLQLVQEAAELAHATGQTVRAEQMLQDVLEHRDDVLGRDHPDTLTTVRTLATVLTALGRTPEAEALLHDVNDRRSTWDTRTSMANALLGGGQHEQALELFHTLAAQAEQTHGEVHPTTARARNNLAAALFKVGETDRAEHMFRNVLRALDPDEEPALRAAAHNNLGTILFFRRKLGQAERELRAALDLRERHYGLLHPETIATVDNLARVLAERGHGPEAVSLARRCLDVYTTSLPAGHPKIAEIRDLLANMGTDR